MSPPLCFTCKTECLRMASPNYRIGEEWWCPTCRDEYVVTEAVAICGVTQGDGLPRRAGPVVDLGSKVTGAPYALRLLPDALIEIRVGKDAVRTLTQEEASHFAGALGELAKCSHARRLHLRGADRWGFRVDGAVTFARLRDEECRIVPYTVGPARSGREPGHRTCARCRVSFRAGTKAWKATDWSTTYPIPWQHTRFCARCPEYTTEARVKRGLRVIDGGKGKATG